MRRFTTSFLALSLLSLGAWGVEPVAGQPSVPPPTPVPPFGSPSPYPTELATPEDPEPTPKLTAESVALVDAETGAVLFARRARTRRPIASLTKIMTALLVLEATSPREPVTVSPLAAAQGGASLGLRAGERVRARHLVYALMLQSANDAAVALAEHVSGSVDAFVRRMNRRAEAMGLRDTHFRSPNGLDDRGYSTALDLVRLTTRALRHPTLAKVVRTKFHTIPSPEGPARRIQNRNILLWFFHGGFGVKSGYTAAAGSCLVAGVEQGELRLLSVVLGAPLEAYTDSATLLDHGFATFERRRVVIQGERLEPIRVGGLEAFVEAAATLRVVLRRTAAVRREVTIDPSLELPLAKGTRVGEVAVVSGDRELGRVPLVTAETVAVPAEPDVPWSRRLWDSAAAFLGALFQALAD